MSLFRRFQRLIWLAPLAALGRSAAAFAQTPDPEQVLDNRSWWLPEDVSTHGAEIDLLFDFILWMTGIVGILLFIVLGVFLVKYRYRPDRKATFTHGNSKLELVWTIIPALLMAATAAVSHATWKKVKYPEDWPTKQELTDQTRVKIDLAGVEALADEKTIDDAGKQAIRDAAAEGDLQTIMTMLGTDATLNGHATFSRDVVHVHVIARQFTWFIHYPGPDGKHGRRLLEKMKPSGSPADVVGLDTSDPDAKDDFIYERQMVVPVDRKVLIHLTSIDVIHSFFLPNFRVKQDATPGQVARVWLQSRRKSEDVIGEYGRDDLPLSILVDDNTGESVQITRSRPFDIVCAELCGAQHYGMFGLLYVVSGQEYERYLEANAKRVLKVKKEESSPY